MKHLHFVQSTESLEGGGLGRAAWELSNALRFPNCESHLVTTGRRASRDCGISVYQRRGPTRMFYAPELHRNARKIVSRCDVVHGHGFYAATNWILGRETRRQHKSFVYHVHGIFEPWILARSQRKKRVAHWLFENANYGHAGLWRALTSKEADQIRARGITAPIVVCPNGIDLETFAEIPSLRDQLHIQKRKCTLLFLGRLHPKKGLDLLLRAWAELPSALRKDWGIVIAGPDELNHRSEIEELAVELNVSEELEFVGEVSGDNKLHCLAAADAFVLPSRSEGFSVAILEAMACGLPVLATTACNFPELASDGGGWCVSADGQGLQSGLVELLQASDTELSERGLAARGLVERRYTWPSIARTLNAACQEHLNIDRHD